MSLKGHGFNNWTVYTFKLDATTRVLSYFDATGKKKSSRAVRSFEDVKDRPKKKQNRFNIVMSDAKNQLEVFANSVADKTKWLAINEYYSAGGEGVLAKQELAGHLQNAVMDNSRLTCLNLSSNDLRATGVQLLAVALEGSAEGASRQVCCRTTAIISHALTLGLFVCPL